MQCTAAVDSTRGGYASAVRDGLPTDAELAELSSGAPPVAVRLVLRSGTPGCSCTLGAGPEIVALAPDDAGVPPAQRAALAGVGPGLGVTDTAWRHLLGGTVALVGLDVRVDSVSDLDPSSAAGQGSAADPSSGAGPILVALADVAHSLARTPETGRPLLRTVVVLPAPSPETTPVGWHVSRSADGWVPLRTGTRAQAPPEHHAHTHQRAGAIA